MSIIQGLHWEGGCVTKSQSDRIVALVGQPNCGKSSLFNKLTGVSQQMGNWPGVTVSLKDGRFKKNRDITIVDLPGVYGLSPLSEDERVTRDFLLKNKPDLIINIVEGPSLERGLFLTLQAMLLDIPMILVVNKYDLLSKQGIEVDIEKLEYFTGMKVIALSARTSENIDYLESEIEEFFSTEFTPHPPHLNIPSTDNIYKTVHSVSSMLCEYDEMQQFADFYSLKLLEGNRDIEKLVREKLGNGNYRPIKDTVESLGPSRKRTVKIIEWLYSIARGVSSDTVSSTVNKRIAFTDALDIFLLNRFIAVPLFLIVMFIIFFLTYNIGDFIVGFLEQGLEASAGFVQANMPEGFVRSLINEGLIGGVGNVIVLLPYIFIMFLLIQLLEDSGYMARIAFIMDRFMHKMGLHGRSFIPIIMGFGCSVPAIMAVRSLESKANRLKTILIIPFIPCSARLTVIVLIGSALFDKQAPFVIFFLYVMSIVIAMISGIFFSKMLIKETSPGMIMELPDYTRPQVKQMFLRATVQAKEYLIKAGTLIFIMSVIIFILSYFPTDTPGGSVFYIGKFLTPIFKPLSFDLPMTVSLITGFFAKEAVISTLSVLYDLEGMSLSNFLNIYMNPITGFVFLVFMMIYVPCIATVIMIKKETGSMRWTLFSIIYSIAVAYGFSMAIKLSLMAFL